MTAYSAIVQLIVTISLPEIETAILPIKDWLRQIGSGSLLSIAQLNQSIRILAKSNLIAATNSINQHTLGLRPLSMLSSRVLLGRFILFLTPGTLLLFYWPVADVDVLGHYVYQGVCWVHWGTSALVGHVLVSDQGHYLVLLALRQWGATATVVLFRGLSD
jgi:hypothetical protein